MPTQLAGGTPAPAHSHLAVHDNNQLLRQTTSNVTAVQEWLAVGRWLISDPRPPPHTHTSRFAVYSFGRR